MRSRYRPGCPRARHVRLHELEGERVMAGWYRSVRREDRRGAYLLERRVERRALLDSIPDALQRHEGRMPLVQVPHRRLDAHGTQCAHAAKTEDNLLLEPHILVAAVEPRRELPVPRRVFFEVGVQQEQPDLADPDLPHLRLDRPVAERDLDDARAAAGRDRRPDRGVVPVDALVCLFLPAFRGDLLVEVTLRVHEPDADERQPEVAGFLAEVACEHAQTPGVDRERLVDRELRREVGNDLRGRLAVRQGPPGFAGGPRSPQVPDRVVVEGEEPPVLRDRLQPLRGDLAQHAHGVVCARSPERVVELAEEAPRAEMPAPPEIRRQFAEVLDSLGQSCERSSHSG